MNQINENILVLSPGDQYDETYENYLKIYLSGSLDISGKGISWQEKFINGLAKLTTPHPESPEIPDYSAYKFLIINPLMPVSGEPTIDNPQFLEKAQWELGMMGQADVIFCNFLKKSTMLSAIQGHLLWETWMNAPGHFSCTLVNLVDVVSMNSTGVFLSIFAIMYL